MHEWGDGEPDTPIHLIPSLIAILYTVSAKRRDKLISFMVKLTYLAASG